jgi:N-acetylmuramoyl-L-alanine amidase
VVLEVDDLSDYNAFLLPNPPRLIIDIHGKPEANPGAGSADSAMTSPLAKSAMGPPLARTDQSNSAGTAKTELAAGVASNSSVKKKIVEVDNDDGDPKAEANPAETKRAGNAAVTPASERSKVRLTRSVREAQPMAKGDRSLIRALGLKIGKIVIDPGHGGFDTGTIGPNGLLEKDLVLDVSRRLGKMLEARLGAEVEYTRRDDTFIPLETRTAIANQDQADLFISVHANSSSDPDARGVETYYLNFSSSAEALEVAARENAVSEKSIHELQDLVKKIALQEKIDESREFATDVESALHSGLALKNPGLRDRGVKKAPFIVLIGANMPSILAEVSFVSNPGDERRLETSEFRQRIAESLYRGIAKYVGGLSGVKVASKIEKTAGP